MKEEKKEIKGGSLILRRDGGRTPLRGLKKWVAALRSEKYKQGTGYLCSHDEYCCLGVFCEVMDVESHTSNLHYKLYGPKEEGAFRVLPETITREMGISDDGAIPGNGSVVSSIGVVYRNLAELNDSEMYDFGMIADVIEFFWKEQETSEGTAQSASESI